MAVKKVTEDWSKRTVSVEANQLTTRQVYDVEFDNADDPAVRPLEASIASDGTTFIPAIYAVHPFNSWLYVKSKHVDTIGPCHYKVIVNYNSTLDPATGQPQTPLLEEPEFSWHFVVSNEQINADINGKPIMNSAGVVFDPGITQDFYDLVLRIKRNESTYYPLRASEYKGAVNSDVFMGFPAGKVLCTIMKGLPTRAAQLRYYRCTYEFHIRWDNWKRKITDEGYREKTGKTAKDGSSETEEINDKNSMKISQPFLLDGNGKKLSKAKEDAGEFVKLEFVTRRSLPFSVLNL